MPDPGAVSTNTVIPLPQHLNDSLRVNWHISSWCNYSCQYCPVMVFHQRSKSRATQEHAFDHYPVSQWLEAIGKFKARDLHLKISGGEPFLDRKNFRDLLAGLTEMKHIRVGIDTNGYWDPDYFRDIDKSRIWVNVAFHPTQVEFAEFFPRLLKIRESGFGVPIVNFVLAPENLDQFDHVITTLEKENFFVNISTMIPTGVYLSRTERTDRELDIVEKYNTPLDNHFKIVKPPTKDKLCFYPAMTYYIMYDGSVRVACLDVAQNLFTDGIPEIPRQAVPCPHQQCIGCSDMYRALVDEPLVKNPLKLFTLEDYAQEVQTHRRQQAKQQRWESSFVGRLFGAGRSEKPAFRTQIPPEPPPPDMTQMISANAIRMALPDSPVFGHIDQPYLEARSRDRLSISGWAVSRRNGAPIEEVKITVDGKEIGVIHDFFYRPDVAVNYGRPDMAKCGWRTMVFLPQLAHGEYDLVPKGVDKDGAWSDLPSSKVRIVD